MAIVADMDDDGGGGWMDDLGGLFKQAAPLVQAYGNYKNGAVVKPRTATGAAPGQAPAVNGGFFANMSTSNMVMIGGGIALALLLYLKFRK